MKLEIVQAVKAHPLSSLKNPVTLLFLGLAFFSPHSEASSAQIIATNAHGSEKFQSEQAQFGPTFNVYGYSGLLLLSQPVNACSEIDPAPDYSVEDYAYFVLIEQGECDPEDKVLIAQAAGFDGVIVYNALDDTLKSMKSNGAGDVSIPSTFVGKSDGLNLRANYTWNHNAIYYNAKVVVKGEFLIPLKCYLIPFVVIVGVCFCIMLLFVLFKLVRDHRARLKNRLSRRGLKKLPTRKWKKGDPDCIDWESCAICLEDYEDGHKLRVLPCKHAFHCKCIDPWLTETRRVCPLCKQRITPRGELEEPSPPPTPHAAHNPEEGEGGMEGENTSEGGESDDALLGGNEHNRERSMSNSRFNHDTRRQTPSRLSSQRRNASLESGSITQDLINSHHLEPDYVDDESSDDSSNFETSERPQVNLRRSRQRRSLDAPSATSDPESNDSNVERRTRLSKVIGFFSGRRGTRSGSGVESESGSSNVQGTEDDTRVGRALGSNQLQVYENDVGFILQSEDVNDIVGDGNRDHTDVSSTTSSSMSAAVSFTESVPRNGQNPKRSQQDTNEKSLDSDSMSKCESSSKGVSTSGRKDTSSTPTAADLFRTDSSNQNDRDPPASPRENQFRDDVALLKDF